MFVQRLQRGWLIIPVYTVTGVGTFCVCTASAERMVSLNSSPMTSPVGHSFLGDFKVFNYQYTRTLVDLTRLPVLNIPEVVLHSLVLKVPALVNTTEGARARYCITLAVCIRVCDNDFPYRPLQSLCKKC